MNSYLFQYRNTRIFSATAQRILFLIISVIVSMPVVAGSTNGAQVKKRSNTGNTHPGLVLTAFNAAINDNKVHLYWVTGMEKDFSHFVIERSSDGVEYKDAAMVFATGNSDVQQSYFFADAIKPHSKAVVYYRLRMVSTGGKYTYSAPRVIKPGQTTGGNQLQLFPNPVANELRITIPEAWQHRAVGYDVYNGNGQLVKHLVNQAASQTELVNMQGMGSGVYMVKAYSGADTAVQWIIKK